MITILVPAFAASKKDVETIVKVLEDEILKNTDNKFEAGLEIIGIPEHFQKEEHLEAIVENVLHIARGMKIFVHGFSGLAVYTQGIADMSKGIGGNLLDIYLSLAKKLNAEYVHVHGGAGYKGVEVPRSKPKILDRIKNNLLKRTGQKTQGGRDILIGIENLPTPSACDFDNDPYEVWRDNVEGIDDCLNIVRGTSLKVTFDTAHYGINRGGYIDLAVPADTLGTHLYNVHIGDVSGYWEPYKSKAYDGVIPGEGRIGKDSFESFFRHIRKHFPSLNICLEIHNKDFNNPVELRESLRRVNAWLAN